MFSYRNYASRKYILWKFLKYLLLNFAIGFSNKKVTHETNSYLAGIDKWRMKNNYLNKKSYAKFETIIKLNL